MRNGAAPFHARTDLTVDLRFFVGWKSRRLPAAALAPIPSLSFALSTRSDATESAYNLTPGCCLAPVRPEYLRREVSHLVAAFVTESTRPVPDARRSGKSERRDRSQGDLCKL